MTRLSSAALLVMTFIAGFAFAAQRSPQRQPASAEEAIRQVERDWIAAEQAGDAVRFARLIADDWQGVNPAGKTRFKAEMVADIKSGDYKVESLTIGPMDVKVLGTVAVCQGSDTEKSTFRGEDTSGRYVWTDVFVLRDGRWQAVRSHIAQAK